MHIKKYFLVIFTVIGLVLLLLIFLNEKNSHCNILEIFIPTVYDNPSEKCKLRLINTLNKSEIPIMQAHHRLASKFYKFMNGKAIETKADEMIAKYFIEKTYKDYEILTINGKKFIKLRQSNNQIKPYPTEENNHTIKKL